jgi:hypothetical protein
VFFWGFVVNIILVGLVEGFSAQLAIALIDMSPRIGKPSRNQQLIPRHEGFSRGLFPEDFSAYPRKVARAAFDRRGTYPDFGFIQRIAAGAFPVKGAYHSGKHTKSTL